jgi:hypothetical protein
MTITPTLSASKIQFRDARIYLDSPLERGLSCGIANACVPVIRELAVSMRSPGAGAAQALGPDYAAPARARSAWPTSVRPRSNMPPKFWL